MTGSVGPEIPAAPPVLGGDRVYRIHWVLGTDRLRAVCHCGSERIFDDPVPLWEWLLDHPAHQDGPGGGRPPAPRTRHPEFTSP